MAAASEIERAKRLFDQVVDLPQTMQPEFLVRACGDDQALLRLVEAMLEDFNKESFTPIKIPFIVEADPTSMRNRFSGTERFAVQRRLGSGAFGTVYEALDLEQQILIAIKVLHSQSSDIVLRFKDEPGGARTFSSFADA
jgi:hypothetical protein